MMHTFCQLVGIKQPAGALTTTAGLSSVAQVFFLSSNVTNLDMVHKIVANKFFLGQHAELLNQEFKIQERSFFFWYCSRPNLRILLSSISFLLKHGKANTHKNKLV